MTDNLLPIVNTVKSVADTSTPFGKAISNTLADVWQRIIGDRVTAWRLSNAAKISQKLSSLITKTGQTLDLSRIPHSYAFSWFEEATRQDEPVIQELFAKLLLQAVDGNEEALQRRNIDIISRMSPQDAKALEQISSEIRIQLQLAETRNRPLRMTWNADYEWMLRNFVREGVITSMLPIENLTNIGVISENPSYYLDSDEVMRKLAPFVESPHTAAYTISFDDALKESLTYSLTLTGVSLLKALEADFIDVPT